MSVIIGILLGVGIHYLPISKGSAFRIFMYFLQGGGGI